MTPALLPDRGDLAAQVFALAADAVRYVATYLDGRLLMQSRPSANVSSAETDRFEELVVNPTLLTLLRQRGEIDCGGLTYAIVRYGAFFQIVVPHPRGHVSVAVELSHEPVGLADAVAALIADIGAP